LIADGIGEGLHLGDAVENYFGLAFGSRFHCSIIDEYLDTSKHFMSGRRRS
jgi:hypothetical protein